MRLLGKIYKSAFPLLADGQNANAYIQFGWIPSSILEVLYLDEPEMTFLYLI